MVVATELKLPCARVRRVTEERDVVLAQRFLGRTTVLVQELVPAHNAGDGLVPFITEESFEHLQCRRLLLVGQLGDVEPCAVDERHREVRPLNAYVCSA